MGLIDSLKAKWDNLLLIAAIVGAVMAFFQMRAEAENAQKEMKQTRQHVEQLAQIASDLKDPTIWLRQWLVLHNVDTTQARIWSQMQKGPVPDSAGKPLPNIPFLQWPGMPELGVLVMYSGESLKVLDTLWKFPMEVAK